MAGRIWRHSLLGISAALALVSCQTAPPPAPPTRLSLEEAQTALRDIEQRLPAQPADSPLAGEWATLQVALRRSRYLSRWYEPTESVLDRLTACIHEARRSSAAVEAGTPPPRIAGERMEGYYSANDDSFQPFLRYLPPAARRGRPLPLIVFLHGYSPSLNIANWEYFPETLVEFAEAEGWALAAPFGRGNTDFQNIGEQDVLAVIDEMTRRYAIDTDRILLAGISMGGMGTWTIGAHYPHRFAGLVVVSGRGDYYVWQNIRRQDLPSYKQTLIDTEFAGSLLPNLAHLPIFCVHGGADTLVPVAEARHIVDAVQTVNPSVQYVELDGADHWIFEETFARRDLRQWILHRRRPAVSSFQVRTGHSKYDRAHWVQGLRVDRTQPLMNIAAREEAGRIAVHVPYPQTLSVNRLALPRPWRSREIAVEWPGHEGSPVPDAPAADPSLPTGPVKEAFLSPFTFVFAGNPADTNAMEEFRKRPMEWYRYAKSFPRVAQESSLSPQDLENRNLFLFGEPETSSLIRRVLDTCPIHITPTDYLVGATAFRRAGHGLCFVYRSPWSPQRLVVVQSGTPWGRHLSDNHRYDFLPDYIVYTDQPDPDGSNHALIAGFFTPAWQLPPPAR